MYRFRKPRALAPAALLAAAATAAGGAVASAEAPAQDLPVAAASGTLTAVDVAASPSVIGIFRGKEFRLADGWGDAHACSSDGVTARCYASEAEMDAAEGPLVQRAPLADCALPAVRLYPSTGFGGDVLQITTRYTLINLAGHGFNNVTSSYRIGACDAYFYDTTTGGTGYPGSTTAWSSASSMWSGWDNAVGSVYIN